MSINIELFRPRNAPAHLPSRCLLVLDGGVYWYLFPHLERLAKQTGQMIDLYDCAKFTGDSLGSLDDVLAEASQRLEHQPEQWDQTTGEQTHPVAKTLTERTSKEEVSSLILSLRELVAKATEGKGVISFTGD